MASDYNEEIKESSFPVDFHGEPEPIDMYGVWVKSGPRDPSLPQTDPDPLQETETLPQTGMQPETGEIPAEPDFAAENTEVSAEDSLAALDLPQDWEDTLSSGQETGESVSGTAQEEFREEPEAEPVPVFEEPAEEDNRAGAAEITDEDVSSLFLSGDPVPAEEDFSALISGTEEPENQTLEDFTFEDVDFDEIAVEPPVPGPEAAEAPAGEPAGRNVEFTAISAEDDEEIGEFPAEDFAPPAGEAAAQQEPESVPVAADSGTGDGETEETGPSAFPDAFESSVPEPAARPAEDSGGPGLDDFTQTEGSLPDIRFEETDVPAFPESAAAPAGKTAAQQEPEAASVAADSGTGAGETEEIDLSAFLDAFESSVPEPAARPAEDSGDLDLDDFINAVNESGGHTEKEKEKIFDDIEPLDLDLEFDEEFIAETEKKEAAGAVSAHSEYFDSEFGVEFFDETAGDAPRPPENTAGSADSDFDDFDAMFASIQDEAQPEATPAETPAAAGKSAPAEAEIEAQPFVQQETHTEADTENTSEFDDFLQSLEDTPSAPVQQHTGSTAGSAPGFVLNVTEEDEDETGSVPVQDQEEDDGENISVSLRSSGTGGEPPAGPSPGISFSPPAAHSTADDDELDRILAEVSFDTADTATPETAPNAESVETAESEPEAVAEADTETEIAANSDFADILPAESGETAETEPEFEPEAVADSDFAGILPAESAETAEAEPETEAEPEIAADSDFDGILPAETGEAAEAGKTAESEPELEPEAVAEPEIAADSDFAGILPAESVETAESGEAAETDTEPEIAVDSDFASILPTEAEETAESGEAAETEPELEPEAVAEAEIAADSDFTDILPAESAETAESEPETDAEPEIAADSDFDGILPAESVETAESEPEAVAEADTEPEIAADSDFASILPAEAEETAETETEPEIAADSDFASILPAESEPEAEAEPLAKQEAVADSDFAGILPAESEPEAEAEPLAKQEAVADSDFAGILPAESGETAEAETETAPNAESVETAESDAEPEIAADSDFAGILPAETGETAETETEPEAVAEAEETAESEPEAEAEPLAEQEAVADSDFTGILPAETEETAESEPEAEAEPLAEQEAVADSDFADILPAESAETAEAETETEPELEPEAVAEAEIAADSDFAGILPAEAEETAESEPEAVAEAEAVQNGKEEKPVDFPAGQEYTDASAEEKDILFDDLSALEHDLRHGGAENTDKIHEEEMNEKSNEILLTIAAELSSIKQELANLKFGMVPAGAAPSEQSAEDIPPSSVPDETANAAAQPAPEEPAEAEAETVKNTGEAQDFPDIEISHITNIDEDDDTAYLSGAGEEADLDNVAIEDEPDLEILDLDKEKLEEPELSDFSVEIGDIGISGTEFTESAEETADGLFAEPQTEAETASVAGTETGLPAAENDNGDIPVLSLVDETEAGTFEDLDFRPMEDSMEDQPEAEPVMEIPDIQTPEIPEEIFAQQEEEPAAAISGIPDSAGQEDEPEIPEELSAADPAASGDGNAAAEIPETETEGENPPVQPAAEIKPEAAVQNTEGEISGGEAKDAEAKTETLPSDLKEEIKSVLSYMDQLLENLPEEKIEEFARSKHFEVYKKLFEDLGIS